VSNEELAVGADAQVLIQHRHMARGGHGLSKVSPGPAKPNPSMPFQGWPLCSAGDQRPSSTLLDTLCRTPLLKSGGKTKTNEKRERKLKRRKNECKNGNENERRLVEAKSYGMG
jgi:hypothetical protein